MSESEIFRVDSNISGVRPKLVTFQNGQLLTSVNESSIECESFLDTKRNKRILAAATERLIYTGEESNENDMYHTLLAIRNKKTNKVRLVPLNTVTLGVNLTKSNSVLNDTLNSSALNVRDLNKQFGSKKSRIQTEQIEKMKMDVSHVKDQLNNAVADVKIKEEDLNKTAIDDSEFEFRPKINRNAATVEQVYDLKSILTQTELDSLEELATQVKEEHTIPEQLTPFALDCVNKLKVDSAATINQYEIILYVDAILKFFKIPAHQSTKKKLIIQPYPDVIISKLVNEFTVMNENHRQRPITMREKAICYVLVLALIAMNYKLDLTSLPLSINAGLNKLLDISRVIGAQVTSKEKNSIVLKLPLPSLEKGIFKKRKRS